MDALENVNECKSRQLVLLTKNVSLTYSPQFQSSISGSVTFEAVSFAYPTRPDTGILNCLDLSVKAGQTVALVGESGSGKSTCVQLLQRFYDCNAGAMVGKCMIFSHNK